MGEYATLRGTRERIKIGTCEEMLYLRWDQARAVQPEAHSVNPVADRFRGIRFRFPFPHEDRVRPGAFGDPSYGLPIDGLGVPEGVEHGTVQFVARHPGLVLSIPCPMGIVGTVDRLSDYPLTVNEERVRVHANGWNGDVHLIQQRWLEADEHGPERLVSVLRCGACGRAYRAHDASEGVRVAAAIDRMATVEESRYCPDRTRVAHLRETARRVLAGYGLESLVDA